MNTSGDIEKIQIEIDEAKAAIKLRDDLNKLSENSFFDAIIKKGYLKEEAIRLTLGKANPAMNTDNLQKNIDNQLMGISCFNQYLYKIHLLGNTASQALEGYYKTQDELVTEEED